MWKSFHTLIALCCAKIGTTKREKDPLQIQQRSTGRLREIPQKRCKRVSASNEALREIPQKRHKCVSAQSDEVDALVQKIRAEMKATLGKPNPYAGRAWWWLPQSYTIPELARYYELSERTLFRYRSEGIDVLDIRAVIEAQEESAVKARGPQRVRIQEWLRVHRIRFSSRERVLGG